MCFVASCAQYWPRSYVNTAQRTNDTVFHCDLFQINQLYNYIGMYLYIVCCCSTAKHSSTITFVPRFISFSLVCIFSSSNFLLCCCAAVRNQIITAGSTALIIMGKRDRYIYTYYFFVHIEDDLISKKMDAAAFRIPHYLFLFF